MKSPLTTDKGLLWLDPTIWDSSAKNVYEAGGGRPAGAVE